MKYIKFSFKNLKASLRVLYFELYSDLLELKKNKLFLVVFCLGTLLRMIHLSQPIKGDEATTFLAYVEPINPLRVFVYTAPNNHILHTLLVKISFLLFGSSLVAIRLPAFFASLGIIFLVYTICKKFGQNGIFAAIIAAFWPYLIAYSNNSRGYSLFCLLSLFLVYNYIIFRSDLNKSKLIILSTICSLGIFTIPTFLILIIAIFIWISIDNFMVFKNVKEIIFNNIFLSFYTSLFSLFLYIPVFILSPSGFKAVLNDRTVGSLNFDVFINSIGKSFLSSFLVLTQLLPSIYVYILFLFFIIGIIAYFKDSQIFYLTLFPLILFSSLLLISLKLVIPPERTWIFFIPFFLIVVDKGLSKIIFNQKDPNKLFLLFFIVISLITTKPFLNSEILDIEEISFPDAEFAVNYIESQRIILDKEKMGVRYLYGDGMPLNYYNWLKDAKIHVYDNRIYQKRGIFESLKEDFERFLNSKWQIERQIELDYFIVNKNYLYEKKGDISYQDLIEKYPLVMKSGALEIYSAKQK